MKRLFCIALLALLFPVSAQAQILIEDDFTTGIPANRGFTGGGEGYLRIWARNDSLATSGRDVYVVLGAFYPIDVQQIDRLGYTGPVVEVDDSAAGGYTRTRAVDEEALYWSSPLPASEAFLSNGPGYAYVNYRNDDQEGWYDIDGWRYVWLEPGVLYLQDLARFKLENGSDVNYLVALSP